MKNTNDLYIKAESKLRNYKNIKCKILNLTIDLDMIKNEVEGIRGVDYQKEHSATNSISSSVEDEVIHREKRMNEIEKEIELLNSEIEKIDNSMNMILNDVEKEIVKEIYFEGNKNYMTARKLDLTEPTIIKIKKSMIKKLINVLSIT